MIYTLNSKLYIYLVSKLVIYTLHTLLRKRVVSRAFLKAKYSAYAQNFQWDPNSIFPNGKIIFSNLFSLANT